MIELNVVTGSEGRASNAGAGLFLSGSTLANDASLVLSADGGRFKASGSAAGFDIQLGGDYRINNTAVLSATTLGGGVLASSLTSLGTIANLTATAGSIATLNGAMDCDSQAMINVNIDTGAIELVALNINGGTDINAAVDAADLLIIDDGASGTNRKVTMARIKTFVETGISPAEAVKDLSGNNDPAEVGVN